MAGSPPAERRSLPLSEWPEADRRMWQELARDADDLDLDPLPVTTWSSRRRAVAQRHYGTWLRWLRDRGDLDAPAHPGDRADKERMMAFLEAAAGRLSPGALSVTTGNLIGVLRSMAPERDWEWMAPILRRISRRMRRAPRGWRHIVPADAIWRLALTLLEGAVATDGVNEARFRDGLMLAILIAAPMRIANFTSLEVDRHLRRGITWEIDLPAEETKTRRDDHWPLPASLTGALDTFLGSVRPVLLVGSAATNRLWIGEAGLPMSAQQIRVRIKTLTEGAFGRPVLPHSFRHCAVTSFTHQLPAHAAEAPAVLGHRSAATTERHYIIGQRLMMMENYHRCLRKVEKDAIVDTDSQ